MQCIAGPRFETEKKGYFVHCIMLKERCCYAGYLARATIEDGKQPFPFFRKAINVLLTQI